MSSFQLEDVHAFRPAVGVFLNLTPDHLDRHGTMERYLACKANLFVNQGPGDVAVLSLDDPLWSRSWDRRFAPASGGPRGLLLDQGSGDDGASDGPTAVPRGARPDSWVDDGWIFLDGRPVLACRRDPIPGRHNLENCLAAGTAALGRGVELDAVAEGLLTFQGSRTAWSGQESSAG